LNGFRDMMDPDVRLRFQVGDGSRDFEYPVVGPGGKTQFIDGGFQEMLRLPVCFAETADRPAVHPAVAVWSGFFESFRLNAAGIDYPLSNGFRRFAPAFLRQILMGNRRYFDVNIDPIQKRTGYPGPVTMNLLMRAAALFFGVGKIAAGAGVHGRNQHKV